MDTEIALGLRREAVERARGLCEPPRNLPLFETGDFGVASPGQPGGDRRQLEIHH
jgi:hypothetical protein